MMNEKLISFESNGFLSLNYKLKGHLKRSSSSFYFLLSSNYINEE